MRLSIRPGKAAGSCCLCPPQFVRDAPAVHLFCSSQRIQYIATIESAERAGGRRSAQLPRWRL